MIELLLQAERALSMGMVDQAERMYRQAADADPRNSIAVVGLARVALERADDAGALRMARRALLIDPENVAAVRLAARLEEVMTFRGEPLPAAEAPIRRGGAPEAEAEAVAAQAPDAALPAAPSGPSSASSAPASSSAASSSATSSSTPPGPSATTRRTGLDRLFRRNRP